jgi:hypothetical protein
MVPFPLDMKAFESFTRQLERLAQSALTGPPESFPMDKVRSVLNGRVADEFFRRVPRSHRKSTGTFFTVAPLQSPAFRTLQLAAAATHTILDPACGAGDLLLAQAAHLPVSDCFYSTLLDWGKRLHGYDLQSQLIRSARARLVLAAFLRTHGLPRSSMAWDLRDCFPNIRCGDGLASLSPMERAPHILLNPPFTQSQAPASCTWGSGRVSDAAVFLEYCVRHSQANTLITAVLPDVLRSGARYERWRAYISSRATIDLIDVFGAFDTHVDVDVFVVNLTLRDAPQQPRPAWCEYDDEANPRLGDFFSISVGPVVPHRDPDVGPLTSYLHARTATPWQELDKLHERRRHVGRVTSPPFVVVRRTSSPRDRARAKASLITGKLPIAVENHLLILEPLDHSLETCRAAISSLRNEDTNRWLNRRIRCRHLTVAALSDLPFWDHAK